MDYVLKQKSVPYTITTSYGDDEQTVPLDYAQRVCSELAQLGARGVTLLFSSGDSGVGANGTCTSNDGTNTPEFLPGMCKAVLQVLLFKKIGTYSSTAFPASCPYVTTVGGTRDFAPEQVAYDTSNGYVAGSGFSNYFAQPSYQVSFDHLQARLLRATLTLWTVGCRQRIPGNPRNQERRPIQ